MASQRPGLGPSGLSADSRLKSPGTIASPGSLLLKKRGGESSTERVRTLPQPKMPSRLPQSLPQRQPSDTQPEPIQPRVTAGNRNSKILGNTTSITLASTSRLPAPTSKPRNVLRRKNSGISQEAVNSIRKGSRDETGNHSKTSSSSSASNPRSQISIDSSASSRSDRNPATNTMEIRVAHQVEVAVGAPQIPTLYPELDRYRDVKVPVYNGSFGIEVPYPLTTHDLPPPTPLFSGSSSQRSGFSSSPCTRFSESPGPGPYSRDTTPTSMSSQSPGMVAPLRFPGAGVRMRQVEATQTRPPVSRRRGGSISNELDLVSADPQGLPSVRESLTSSSSNSTVRELERKDSKKRKQLSPLAPSPPPRISSHKFTKSHDGSLSPPRPWRAPPTQPTAPAAAAAQLLPKPGSFSRPRPAQTAQQVPPPRGQPPRRPSRDGTPDLHSQLGLPMPIIQSNLTSVPSEKRSSKLLAPAIVARPGLLSSTSDTHVHLLRPAITREATPAPKMSRMGEDASTIKAEPGRTTRTPSPGVSTFRRFPLFGRRTKTAPEVPLQKDEKKSTRKGPAAGTGHEGYGRVGPARRRSNSHANTSRAIPGTMSSQETIGTNDSFLLERMAPVVIAGGEIIENRNVGSELGRTESSQSVMCERPSVESQNSSQVSLNSTPRNTLWPSAFPRAGQHAQSASVSSRRPSESSESEAPVIKSTLALRRSIQRLKSGEKESPRIPAPIVTQPHVTSPSITSIDASVLMTDDSMLAPSIDAVQGIKASEGPKHLSGPKRLMKRARSPRKWNFFGRNHSQPASETKKVEIPENAAPVAAVAATVKVVQSKPLAFYTMMDSSEQEDTDIPDLEEVLREAKSPDSPTHKQISDSQHKKSEERRPFVTQENAQPSFLTSEASAQVPTVAELEDMSPVKFSKLSAPPSVPLPVPTQAGNIAGPVQGRPSRLPQVGRIPKVISARAEQISPKSFSRPFQRLSVQATPSKMDLRDAYSIAKGPSPPRPSTPVGTEAPVLTQSPGSMLPTYPRQIGQEFLSFSPRKGSQCTTNTTTSSSSGGFNFAEVTAVIPEPDAPLAEDEIWDEYDDLLGDETLKQPQSVRSTRSSFGNQFHLEKYTTTPPRRIEPPLESPTLRSQFQEQQVQSLTQIMHSERIPVSSSVYSSDMAEKVKQLLADHPSPKCSLEPEIPEESVIQPQNELLNKQPEQEQELETEKQSNSLPVNDPRRSDSSGCSQSSEDGSPLALVNLRVGSMTVSKWLTFGHVLFSPVRDELLNDVGSLKRPSILVIDGLGNDDWSFYAAETYPAATFFNLSPRPPRPAARNGSTGLPLSPPNHYQTQYMSHTGKFPFGAESFTAVVFRFPAAAPEAQYRNIISEARRVLKPGGYIELSILDVDLNNMGNRGRKAIRRLKERVNAKSPEVSLGSTSDLILRLLGRKGFADLKTCRVGVPVASVIPRSSGSENGKRNKAAGKGKTIKDERSLPEMISDGSPVADESITKMVAKVGRWWYSQCYESAAGTGIGPGTLGSMWRDKVLLAECEEWGTSLKLMVCHARVPDGRPRLASI
ncbi:hypothetical protein QBC32DRAFT_37963 [Pseudoneurospora amorphoporcata]|uniref:Methyltransferase type 11 domain-containing protein n=1 Tax=Pseudoneurospora amorphoporcata TaxID=241081 RepID=A0AAN6NQT3_9PEZI|nr:hypothetical protein QBC32DRAFT_37963 [Pseudoneurospora amorphoporcata]